MTSCWIVTDEGKSGTENQCVALAEALKLKPVIHRVKSRWPWSILPPFLWPQALKGIRPSLGPPWPQVVIAAGRRAAAPAAAIRKASGGKTYTIFIQDPYLSVNAFDVVVAPLHDHLKGVNVISTVGALHGMTKEKLREAVASLSPLLKDRPKPMGAVLLGGKSRHFTMTRKMEESLVKGLVQWHQAQGGTLLITPSRRTSASVVGTLRKGLSPSSTYFWEGQDPNPYKGFLGVADYFIITADSVSMVCEAAGTGKPIFIVDLPTSSVKFQEFHERLRAQGITRLFEPEKPWKAWSYPPLQETQACASTISKLMTLQIRRGK